MLFLFYANRFILHALLISFQPFRVGSNLQCKLNSYFFFWEEIPFFLECNLPKSKLKINIFSNPLRTREKIREIKINNIPWPLTLLNNLLLFMLVRNFCITIPQLNAVHIGLGFSLEYRRRNGFYFVVNLISKLSCLVLLFREK